jgi:chemotaxis protein methyltransferase WspC
MQLDSLTLDALTPHLYDAGLEAHALDAAHLRWVLRARTKAIGVATLPEYVRLLEADATERDALVDALLVRETRFFRDPGVFTHLRSALAEVAATDDAVLRLASAPCSTGQEAYSLAATLTLAGIAPDRFLIDAFDLSPTVLEEARLGEYPLSSVRQLDEEQRRALGHERGEQFVIHPWLRERVRFERRNLAASHALGDEPQYHAVLCRNLLIYVHAEARRAIAASIAEALLPGGRLVLGSGDLVPEISALFSPAQPAASFAFVRAGSVTHAAPVQGRPRSMPQPLAPRPSRPNIPVARTPVAVPAAENTAETLFRRALQSQAAGNVRLAERRCRQALYLDPAYLPALELLNSLWHSTASTRLRRALEQRIHRMRGETGTQAMQEAR